MRPVASRELPEPLRPVAPIEADQEKLHIVDGAFAGEALNSDHLGRRPGTHRRKTAVSVEEAQDHHLTIQIGQSKFLSVLIGENRIGNRLAQPRG